MDDKIAADIICKDALQKWGASLQQDIAIEEMAELTRALIKCRRGFNTATSVREEMADVSICLEQLILIYCSTDSEKAEFQWYINHKLNRLKDRIAKQG